MDDDPEMEMSPLSQPISSGGWTVYIEIYRIVGETEWFLEIEDKNNSTTVWKDPFESDTAALTEAKKSILNNKITSFIGTERLKV